ncbi:Uncharacterised protein [Mycobacterium tuberculosis]|uniref:Uncharacterized protein n=1 Tax=Mycobacterium tuberculosis TaxID=1773 RepID=A0A655JBG3_MYCTX|nr:Uncharacterised protein [Mycobacterium tuberculosis]
MQYWNSPEVKSSEPTHMVADFDPGTCLWKRSTASSASTTVYPAEICMRNAVRNCDMTAAASTPWPTTSPTTSTNRSPRASASNQSPPAAVSSAATRYSAAMSAPGTTGTDAASNACCITVAESRTLR